jgi:tetratricopeptide (TPR) repeat protein
MGSPDADSSERAKVLVSWKEIAAFLDRAERTAKRWERKRGLPVHRVPGGERSGVFAYSHELSAWLRGEEGRSAETATATEHDQRNEETPASRLANSEAEPESKQAIHSSKPAPEPVLRTSSPPWQAIVWSSVLVLLPIAAAFFAFGHYRSLSQAKNSPVQLAPPGSRHVPSPRAEQLYLQGRYQWSLRTAESLAKSVDAYTQAIVDDPAYAQAYAGLAESYDLLPQYSRVNSADSFQRAKAAASRAIELDPSLAAGHRAKAFVLFYGYWDVAGSDAEFRRALALAPNEAETHHWYGTTLFSRQEDSRSLSQMDEAVRLSPTTPAIVADSAFVHVSLHNNRDVNIRILRELARTQPNLVKSSRYLAGIDLDDRNYPAFLADIRQVAEISHDPAMNALVTAASRGLARGGRSGLLEAIRKYAQSVFDQGNDSGNTLAETYLRLGQPKKALPYFRAALARNEISLMRLSACECVAAVKDDPGYRQLFQQVREHMGLPKATGVHPAALPGSEQ